MLESEIPLEVDDRVLARTEDLLKTDLRFLIESSISILDKDSKLSPLVFNEVQNSYWSTITRRDIILKSRKMGFTTIRLARIIAKCATMPNRRAIIVSHEEEATKRILGRAAEMCKNSVVDLGAKFTENGAIFKNTGSTLYIGTAGSKAFGRGDDITDYLLTEFAWWDKPDLITGVEEACVRDSEGCIESTAHGYGNPFHTMWIRAKAKERGLALPDGAPVFYTPHFFGWWQDSSLEMDCPRIIEDKTDYERMLLAEFTVSDDKLLWRRCKIASMFDPALFPQEYPATPEEAFLVSGSMVFDAQALASHEKNVRDILWRGEIRDDGDKVRMEPNERGRLIVFSVPRKNGRYIIPADIAAGTSDGCYSVADVLDCDTNEQVAQWRGHIAPELFGDVMTLLGAYYNYAHLWPEVNNHGLTTCNRIRDNQYPNLGRRELRTGGTDLGFYTRPGKQGTRIELINAAREAIREYSIKVNSLQTISECRTFVTLENGDMGPLPGMFSDCVIPLGIGAIMLKKFIATPEEARGNLRDRIGRRNVGRGSAVTHKDYKSGYR